MVHPDGDESRAAEGGEEGGETGREAGGAVPDGEIVGRESSAAEQEVLRREGSRESESGMVGSERRRGRTSTSKTATKIEDQYPSNPKKLLRASAKCAAAAIAIGK